MGIVTEFDLLKAIMEEQSLSALKAGDIMNRDPLTVTPETAAPELIRLLEEHHVFGCRFVNAEGKLMGSVAK